MLTVNSPGGNRTHLAPEVQDAMRVFQSGTCHSTPVDFSGQAAFEAGVLLFELAVLTHPIPGYPSGTIITADSGEKQLKYDDEVVCAIGAPLRTQLLEAGYEADAFLDIIRRMVCCDARKRLPLVTAFTALERLFEPRPDDLDTERELVSNDVWLML